MKKKILLGCTVAAVTVAVTSLVAAAVGGHSADEPPTPVPTSSIDGVGDVATGDRPATAATPYSRGVKDVDYFPANDTCDGGAGCTTNAGIGNANLLRITQSTSGGGLAFDGYETTATDPDRLWMAATLGAECRAGYRLSAASIHAGYRYETVDGLPQINLHPWDWNMGISVPNAKTMPSKLVAVNIPMDKLFVAAGGASMVHDFDSLADVFAHGEAVIADRIAAGMTEYAARADGFAVDTYVATNAGVACVNSYWDNHRFSKYMPAYLPLRIEFVGEHADPVGPGAVPTGDKAVDAEVTQAELAVAADACTLRLSARFVANRNTLATYRIIDPYGRTSAPYQVDLKENAARTVEHEIDIPTTPPSSGGGGIDVEAGGPGTGTFSGTFRIEVTAPNSILSNHAGFSVDPCPGQVNPDLDPADGLAGGSDSTHGSPTATAPGPHGVAVTTTS